jgi:segregation and condensation protein A
VFPRQPSRPQFEPETPGKPDVTLFDLLNAVNAILKRVAKEPDSRDVFEDKWTVSEKIEVMLKMMASVPRLKFSDLFIGATNRTEVIVTFLALLELIRLKQITAAQNDVFGEIEISRAETPAPGAVAAAPDSDAPVPEPAADQAPALEQ